MLHVRMRRAMQAELRADASPAWHQHGLPLGERKIGGKKRKKNVSAVPNSISWRRQCFLLAAAQRGELCRKRRLAAAASASSWSRAEAFACSCSGTGALASSLSRTVASTSSRSGAAASSSTWSGATPGTSDMADEALLV
jgi:hypothetical protein